MPRRHQRCVRIFLHGSFCEETNGEIEEYGVGFCAASSNLLNIKDYGASPVIISRNRG